MSYAGPGSRGTRATETRALATRSAGQPPAHKPGRRLPASTGRRATADESNHLLGFAAGIALGIIVGAGAALLFAPRSGADVRRHLARRARRLRDRGEDAWDGLRRELRRARGRRARARAAKEETS